MNEKLFYSKVSAGFLRTVVASAPAAQVPEGIPAFLCRSALFHDGNVAGNDCNGYHYGNENCHCFHILQSFYVKL